MNLQINGRLQGRANVNLQRLTNNLRLYLPLELQKKGELEFRSCVSRGGCLGLSVLMSLTVSVK